MTLSFSDRYRYYSAWPVRRFVSGLAESSIEPNRPEYCKNEPGDRRIQLERSNGEHDYVLEISASVEMDEDGATIVDAWILRHESWTPLRLSKREKQLVINKMGNGSLEPDYRTMWEDRCQR